MVFKFTHELGFTGIRCKSGTVPAAVSPYATMCLLRLPNIKSVAKSAINTLLHRDSQQQVLSRICTGFPLIQVLVGTQKPLTPTKLVQAE